VRITGTIVIATLGLAVAVGCGGNKPQAKHAEATPPAKEADKPPVEVTASPNIAVSTDLAEACKISPEKSIFPRFRYNQDDLLADDQVVLDTIAKCLTDGVLKGRSVKLIGRADPRGTDEYNLALGSQRSSTVRDYMDQHGLKPSQLVETTRGAIDATGTDEDGWRKDRRVDIVLLATTTASK